MRHGWLKIDGVQDGDRTLDEQMLAVWPAVAEAKGKTILDLGCAEGLIGLEFAKAGAAKVLGIDAKSEHLEVAREVCAGYPMEFQEANLNDVDSKSPMGPFDIVLCLGIVHKLKHPGRGLTFAARSSRCLLLLRSGRGSVNGIIRSKHHGHTCDSAAILTAEGFALEKTIDGPWGRDEPVEYWRRSAAADSRVNPVARLGWKCE